MSTTNTPSTRTGRVIVDLSPSVDGFVAGAAVSVERPFGDAGLDLYQWLGLGGEEQSVPDRQAADWQLEGAGAIVMGRTMFEVGIGPWGADGAFRRQCFVVTSRPHEPVTKGPTSFTFVTEGLTSAIHQAHAAAAGGDVMVVGGAAVVDQCLAAGVVDEIRLHLAPLLLGSGTRLVAGTTAHGSLDRVDLELIEAVGTPLAVHLRYRVATRRAEPKPPEKGTP